MGRKKTTGAQCCASTSGNGYPSFIALAAPPLGVQLDEKRHTPISLVDIKGHPTNDFINCDSR